MLGNVRGHEPEFLVVVSVKCDVKLIGAERGNFCESPDTSPVAALMPKSMLS